MAQIIEEAEKRDDFLLCDLYFEIGEHLLKEGRNTEGNHFFEQGLLEIFNDNDSRDILNILLETLTTLVLYFKPIPFEAIGQFRILLEPDPQLYIFEEDSNYEQKLTDHLVELAQEHKYEQFYLLLEKHEVLDDKEEFQRLRQFKMKQHI